MMWGTGWDHLIVGVLMMVLFWGGLAAVVLLALRNWDGQRGDGEDQARSGARAILEERFARGEISEEEFEQRLRVLERRSP